MSRPIIATCNESCNRTFELTEFLTDKLENDVEKTYFLCPHCGHEYVAYYTDAEIRELQEAVEGLDIFRLRLWELLRGKARHFSSTKIGCSSSIAKLKIRAINAAEEAIQVAAMCDKWLQLLDKAAGHENR